MESAKNGDGWAGRVYYGVQFNRVAKYSVSKKKYTKIRCLENFKQNLKKF